MNSKWETAIIWIIGIGVLALIVFVGMRNTIERQISGEDEKPSVLTSRELIETDEGNVFYVTKKLTKLNGKSNFVDEPITIQYTITTVRDYAVASGEIDYKPKWTINTNGLAFGVNYVTLNYIFSDTENNQKFDYIIYNYNEENTSNLEMVDADSDADGLTDYFELTNSETDPYSLDTDGNSIPDGEEDPDNDGLSNIQEQEYGSYAQAMDSDSDGLIDGEEINLGTDLMNEDTDGDTYSDYDEVRMGTDPTDKGDPRKKAVVSYSESTEFNSGMSVEISMETTPDNISSFQIYEIPESFAISSANIEGMIGSGISIAMDGEPESAQINIVLDCEDYIEGGNYYLWYYNEESKAAEYVEEQHQTGNVITATLEHFSKYFVSSSGKDDTPQGQYTDNGIDMITTESREALFESYEDYISTMYGGKAVFSINICAGNIDDAEALNNGSGHSWTSYYYAGDDASLEIKVIDDDFSTNESFGAIGFGGWINGYGFPEYLWKSWDGSLKLPSGYRELYYEGKTDPEGNVIYQSATLPYSEDGMTAENMNRAYISMPFVINENQLEKISEFVNLYKKKYDLNVNNCTTFARDVINNAGIENSIVIDFTTDSFNIGNSYVGQAGSPGQASYSIQQSYPDEHVYVLEEVLDDGSSKLWFTSKMAQACAINFNEEDLTAPETQKKNEEQETGQSAPEIELPNIQEKVDEEIDEQKQKASEWLQKKIEDWLNQWVVENCGGC